MQNDPRLWGVRRAINMNDEAMIKDMEESFQGKVFITPDDVSTVLGCDTKTIINWTKRPEVEKRPPRVYVGNVIRFPMKPFIRWFLLDCGLLTK
jgi:nitrous oxide reductase accessory protein NosL